MLPDVMALEKKLSSMIYKKFGIDEAKADIEAVRRADETMLVIEAKMLFDFPPIENWTASYDARPLRFKPFISRSPKEAEMNFLSAVRILLDDSPQQEYGPEWHDAEKELPAVGQRCEVMIMERPLSRGTVGEAALIRQPDDWGKYIWVNGENLDFRVSFVRKWRPFVPPQNVTVPEAVK